MFRVVQQWKSKTIETKNILPFEDSSLFPSALIVLLQEKGSITDAINSINIYQNHREIKFNLKMKISNLDFFYKYQNNNFRNNIRTHKMYMKFHMPTILKFCSFISFPINNCHSKIICNGVAGGVPRATFNVNRVKLYFWGVSKTNIFYIIDVDQRKMRKLEPS